MNKSNVAVIIVNYNGMSDTLACIESIMQSKTDVDIIVVDNASDNNEGKILQSLYTEIKVIQSENNAGFSAGNNIGIEYALQNRYEYIALLNNDTIVADDMFEYLMCDANENMITVPSMYYYDHPDELWYAGGSVNRWTGNAVHFTSIISNGTVPITFATGCCMMIHHSIIDKVGMLDESYFMYCEDTDYSIRCQMNGIKFKFIPNAKLWHKVGKSTGGNQSSFSIYYLTRNRLNYIRRYRSYFHFTAYIFSICTRCVRMLQLLVKRNPAWHAYQRALIDHVKGANGVRITK